jgi:hypothetical protein
MHENTDESPTLTKSDESRLMILVVLCCFFLAYVIDNSFIAWKSSLGSLVVALAALYLSATYERAWIVAWGGAIGGFTLGAVSLFAYFSSF